MLFRSFSDVPASGLRPGQTLDRLPPGRGVVPFREFFRLIADSGYTGHCSYEAPNPAAWARDPETVAREALAATRALLPGSDPASLAVLASPRQPGSDPRAEDA